MSKQQTKSKEFPFTNIENNNGSTYEKCPEMSLFMFEEEGSQNPLS